MKNKILLLIPIFLIILVYLIINKDSFKTIKQENQEIYDNNVRPHRVYNLTPEIHNNEIVTKSFLKNLVSEFLPPVTSFGGANVSVQQNKYDLLFKDILLSSDKRNKVVYPNCNNYSVKLNTNIDKIYKAELIEVYVPAATDDAVNIPTNGNRLYFGYQQVDCSGVAVKNIEGYITILAGTYESPVTLACELQRQFNNVLTIAGFNIKDKFTGIIVTYDPNLNRYIFADKNQIETGNFIIFSTNGFTINQNLTVTNSIASYLMLNEEIYISGPKIINSADNVLFVDTAKPGDYGGYSNKYINLKCNPPFSNCIISDVVLTNCKIFLSLGRLNGDTCSIVSDQGGNNLGNNSGNIPNIFCQLPNNTSVSSKSVKTLLNQPSNYSGIQFYNPPISKLNKLDIKWFNETGNLVRILDHCFTVRIYYFQKRIDTTDFSIPIP
jgi:hypothetical protein